MEMNRYLKSWTLNEMNMPFSIIVLLEEGNETEAISIVEGNIRKIAAYLKQVEKKFSPFQADSDLSRFQRGDHVAILLEDQEFQAIYAQSILAQEKTKGLFTPFFEGSYNPTGLVKGWLVERIFFDYLKPLIDAKIVSAAAINGGGDMQFGVAEGVDFQWQIGIKNPRQGNRIIATYEMREGAVATSGVSERGDHIKSPHESKAISQMTVVSSFLSVADIWATAGVAGSKEQFVTLIEENQLMGIAVLADDIVLPFEKGEVLYVEKSSLFY